jgi:hypothetical protein
VRCPLFVLGRDKPDGEIVQHVKDWQDAAAKYSKDNLDLFFT